MGLNFWPVLYVHIHQILSKVIYFLFDEDVIVVAVVIIILLFYFI